MTQFTTNKLIEYVGCIIIKCKRLNLLKYRIIKQFV